MLIQSMAAMKCLLDSMLALTKQDRLCHVIHATSDPFYQTWLRQLNIMQHSKVNDQGLSTLAFCSINFFNQIITIGDCSKAETKNFFRERIIPRVPERLRTRLDFEALYDAFGGKLAHWDDYITDFGMSLRLERRIVINASLFAVNFNGQLESRCSLETRNIFVLISGSKTKLALSTSPCTFKLACHTLFAVLTSSCRFAATTQCSTTG
jgi:hypothetical protein